jgi:hypothetical protein
VVLGQIRLCGAGYNGVRIEHARNALGYKALRSGKRALLGGLVVGDDQLHLAPADAAGGVGFRDPRPGSGDLPSELTGYRAGFRHDYANFYRRPAAPRTGPGCGSGCGSACCECERAHGGRCSANDGSLLFHKIVLHL